MLQHSLSQLLIRIKINTTITYFQKKVHIKINEYLYIENAIL